MKIIVRSLVLLICGLIISASLVDLHCTTIRPAANAVVLACSAGRLPR